MATYLWSALSSGQVINPFNPAVDVLNFDDPTISAAFVFVSANDALTQTTFSYGGKTVTLQMNPLAEATTNVTFANGSQLLVGDNTTATANDDAANTLTGTNGNDQLIGLGGPDVLNGGNGNDVFTMYAGPGTGTWGNDTINGGAGFDTIQFSDDTGFGIVANFTVLFTPDGMQGTITGGDGNPGSTLAVSGIDKISGTANADTLTYRPTAFAAGTGLGGPVVMPIPVFDGGAGNDTINGALQDGVDTMLSYQSATSGVTVNLGSGTASDGLGGTDTFNNIDGVQGSQFNDSLTGGSSSKSSTGNFFEWFEGMAGNDTINGAGGAPGQRLIDRVDYVNSPAGVIVNFAMGTASDGWGGTDTLSNLYQVRGSSFVDNFIGSGNDEYFEGLGGNDTIDGGAGNDEVRYSQATAGVTVNLATGSAQATSVDAGIGIDSFSNIEAVRGSNFNDTLIGRDGADDRFEGLAGSDTITGGTGSDTLDYSVAPAAVNINLALTSASDGYGTIDTFSGIENVLGSNFNDTLQGNASVNVLSGRGGSDILRQIDGSGDTLDGGDGTDRLEFVTSVAYGGATGVNVNLATHVSNSGAGTATLASIETVAGTAGNDVFVGGDSAHAPDAFGDNIAETFQPFGGNDTITGVVGIGRTTIVDYSPNTAAQAVYANLGSTPITVLGHTIVGGSAQDGFGGTDTFTEVDQIRGGSGDDILIGGGASRSANGGFFEVLRGNAGNDYIDGFGTSPLGTLTSARVEYNTSTGTVIVNLSAAAISVNGVVVNPGTARDGFGGIDTLLHIDQVFGGSAADVFVGSADGDVFNGAGGNDSFDGGGGNDEVRYQTATTGVVVNLGATPVSAIGPLGSPVIVAAGTALDGQGGVDTFTSIERVRGSDFDDFLFGSNSSATERFGGDRGNDTIDGGTGTGIDYARYTDVPVSVGGITAFIENGSGIVANDGYGTVDTLINIEGLEGSHGNDNLSGGAGDQRFIGRGGSDTLNGGTGSDWAVYSDDPSGVIVNLGSTSVTVGAETVLAGKARDGWAGPANVIGFGGTDTLTSIENATGSNFNDSIFGSAGDNQFRGRTGDDMISGGDGLDTVLFAGPRSDYTFSRIGSSTHIAGPDGTDTLIATERLLFDDGTTVNLSGNTTIDTAGDGRSDILWRNSDGTIVTWQMNGTTVNSNAVGGGPVPLTWNMVDAHGDYNGDGKSDILWRNNDGTVVSWQMNGSQVTSTVLGGPPVPLNWTIIDGHGDYNGDGRSDILWRSSTDGTMAVWQMNGTQVISSIIGGPPVPLSWGIVDAHGDYNGDGKNDILWRNTTDGTVVTWLMNGNQISSSVVVGGPPVPLVWSVVDGHGDYNGDGKSDILWRNMADGTVTIWQMNGTQASSSVIGGAPVPLTWTIVDGHGDYNGDAKSDILWRNTADGTVVTWQMNGTQVTSNVVGGAPVPLNWAIVDGHADYNGDGNSDILWRNMNDGTVVTWQMIGPQVTSNPVGGAPVPLTWKINDGAEIGASIIGDNAANTLVGTDGRDTLYGELGNDSLRGGAGGDRFVFNTAPNGATNSDTVQDFLSGYDTLLLSDMVYSNIPQGPLQAQNFVANSNPAAQDANDFILYNTSSGAVSYDADGSGAGAAVTFATLANHPLLVAQDIYVGAQDV